MTSPAGAKLLMIFSPGNFDDYLATMKPMTAEQLSDAELMRQLSEDADIWT